MNSQQSLGGGARENTPVFRKINTNVFAVRYSEMQGEYSKGFTLAEVLITLGVIGIVAAMTLPSLISNYKKTQVVSKLKSTYSILQNAAKMSEVKYGHPSEWESCRGWNLSCTNFLFERYLKPELKIIKTCIPISKDCWTATKQLDGTLDGQLGNSQSDAIGVVLSNGVSLLLKSSGNDPADLFIYADIDGPRKGLATLGGDVFMFELLITLTRATNPSFYRWGVHLRDLNPHMPRSSRFFNLPHGCIISKYSGSGEVCGALIQYEGWKIPDDYPIKF